MPEQSIGGRAGGPGALPIDLFRARLGEPARAARRPQDGGRGSLRKGRSSSSSNRVAAAAAVVRVTSFLSGRGAHGGPLVRVRGRRAALSWRRIMCESYSRWLLRVSVAQVCQALGWDSVQLSACDLLTDVLQRYLHGLGRGCRRYCELYGRTDPILEDVGEAFKLMGVNLHELEDYILNIEPVTFAHQIPSFPVTKNNVLQFPQPGSKDAEERKEYIPDYLPPIVSSQEEEEEEQVPTDGGTSAEAMQVPLEEEGEMEEDEAINDENYLSKRPLASPEVEEMPVAKRPKLASIKGEAPEGTAEPREPLSSINAQKVPPMLSPVCVQDSAELVPPSPEPPILAPIAKSQLPISKPLEPRALTPKAKVKTSSSGQKSKTPKTPKVSPSPAIMGSPIHSPKTGTKEKKSPGRAKSPKSPKSPKVPANVPQVPIKQEIPSRTPLAALSEKMGKENIQVKQGPPPVEPGKPNSENPAKKVAVVDKTIDDSIDAVIARACAERDPDPFEFSSGAESEGDIFTSPKRLSVSETPVPKALVSVTSSTNKMGNPSVPPSGGTSSSDISWTMDDSIDEVIRKASMGTPANVPANFPYFSSPSASPPTPEPLLKVYEEKTKLASSVEVKKKLKKELKTKMKKKEKQKDKEKNKEKSKDKSKDKEGGKDTKFPWKDLLRDDDLDPYKFKMKDFDDEPKVKVKDSSSKKEREKHKDKKKDKEKGKKDKEKRDKEKVKEKKEKTKASSASLLLPPRDLPLPLFSTSAALKLPALLTPLSSVLPEKLFEEKEKPKEKKKDKKEKKKKKEREKEKEKKEKEKEKKEREKKEKEKEKHKHEKQIKVEPVVPAPSPVIPRLTLKVGAGQDKIVISKVVSTPEAKPSALLARPKTPPPPPAPAPAPVHVNPPLPPPSVLPPLPVMAVSPPPSPAISALGGSKAPVRSVVTETVSNYVIRDEWGNKIWICPGCEKPDDGSPMIGCDDCDDWYHWPCVGIKAAPPEEMQWFCSRCANKKKDKKHKKWKHKAH